MSSSAGPSRVRRPRRSSASTSKGSTASSTGTADGARIGLVKVILVSGDWEVMALYLGSADAKRKGLRTQSSSRPERKRRAGTIIIGSHYDEGSSLQRAKKHPPVVDGVDGPLR